VRDEAPRRTSTAFDNDVTPTRRSHYLPRVSRAVTRFDEMRLAPTLARALRAEGLREATPVQARVIPLVLGGRDVLARAATGSGKTAAYAIPIVQRCAATPLRSGMKRFVRALVVAPTRELATQIGATLGALGRHVGLQTAVISGGGTGEAHLRGLRRGVDVIVATPGRLIDLLGRGLVPLGRVELFVLDEVDRMLDMGFVDDVQRIIASLPERRQTVMLSATVPASVTHLAESLLRDPVRIEVRDEARTAPRIEERVIEVTGSEREATLRSLLDHASARRVIVFVRSRALAARLAERLVRDGTQVEALHGDMDQPSRDRALERFRRGDVRVLVATDVAARGLDVDAVTHVINYDTPGSAEVYTHRIGRTARAGASGIAITFVEPEKRAAFDSMLRARK
jgi:ATP-dependent RNA helicase RhlE